MNLPEGITFEQTLLGSGNGTTVRGLEKGQPVIVKSPEASTNLFSDELFDDDGSKENESIKVFESEKRRELRASGKSEFYLEGRFEKNDEGVFWVRPFIQRSLHEKVSFKETPDSTELLGICRSIVQALAELAQIDGSGHGNLLLSNVLISDRDVSKLKLVDLLGANEEHSRADKRALGLIIYQLVNGEFTELDDKIAAVPDDQDWRTLGSAEQMWRDFCSELLNPYGKYAEADWSRIDQALKKIAAAYSKRKRLKVIALFSVFLTFGAVALLVWKIKFQEEEIVVDLDTIQGQWIELLDNYFSWAGNYLKSKSSFREAKTAETFMEVFYDDKKARLPMKIIGRVSGQGARLQTAPEEVYEDSRRIDVLLLDNSKQQQIVLAHRFVMGLRGKIENWEVLQELSKSNQSFIDSGFEFGAKETQRLIESISFDDGSLTLSRLHALQKSAKSMDELQSLYGRFEVQVASLEEQVGSTFLPKYGSYLRQQLKKPAEDPVAYLRSLVEVSAEALEYWSQEEGRIAKDLFTEQENAFVAEPNFSASDKEFARWKNLVKDFRLIEIPELDSCRDDFVAGREMIAQLNEQINELQEPDLEPAKFDQQFEKLIKVFEADVDLPLIESNRTLIKSAISRNLAALKALVERTEDRWAEVNPDIGERLQQLAQVPENLSPVLSPTWKAYLEREIVVRTEESFSGPREFIVFQRSYFKKLKNFEYFQDTQLTRLSVSWPSEMLKEIRLDLIPGLESIRQTFYDELVKEWVDQMATILFNAEEKLPIEAPTDGFLQRMSAYETELLAYGQILNNALNQFDSWELPEEGTSVLWDSLNEGASRKTWCQSEHFVLQVDQVRRYLDLEKRAKKEDLLLYITDDQNPAFARILALEKVSEQMVLSPDEIGQVGAVLAQLSEQVPASEEEAYHTILYNLWLEAFEESSLDEAGRKVVFSYSDAMNVRAMDLSGRSRFLFEVYSALAELEGNKETYLEDPYLLEEFINAFDSLPIDAEEPELDGMLEALEAVDLEKEKETFENAPFIAKGWSLATETEERLVLTWEDHELVFHLVEDEERDFFIAELESSLDLFNDWMTKKRLWGKSTDSLPREWSVFIEQPYSAIDDYRQGMKLWSISRRGLKRNGITVSSQNFEVDTLVADEYASIEGKLFSGAAVDMSMPIQHTGARLARFFAESMGMSLPTPGQWKLAVEGYSADNAFFWQSRLSADLSAELANEIRAGAYYTERKIEESGYGIDHSTIVARTNEQSDEKFKHLAGNVAEYLYDSEVDTYYVAGGSSFSANFATWKDEHLIPKRNELTAFSDVGIRLALIAPEQSAYMQYITILNEVLK